MPKREGVKVIAQNRKARHDYFVEESLEAGLALHGTEVKSLRQGHCNLKDCFALFKDGEVFVHGMHISPYEQGNIYNVDPLRPKKLLLHKAQIRKLRAQVMQEGYALIPLEVYLKDGLMKVQLGVCKGKKNYDKRDDMARRDAKREMERSLRAKG